MRSFSPEDLERPELHKLVLSGIAPRPIALAATLGPDGVANLSPFSFFNAFSSNPPIVAFSPAYRGRDGSSKDTFRNLKASGECTISVVSFNMVEQVSLASSEYAAEVDEFIKSGLTKLPSNKVAPPGVAESPFVMECKLRHHYEVAAGKPGSGNIMICEIVRFHIKESVFVDGRIDPQRMDLVARMGYDYYCRASGPAIFSTPKPRWNGIGLDALPAAIRNSNVLTGNDLGKLASVEQLPPARQDFPTASDAAAADDVSIEIAAGDGARAISALRRRSGSLSAAEGLSILHQIAALFLNQDDIEAAWQTLYLATENRMVWRKESA